MTSRSSNTPATPVSNPASAQGVAAWRIEHPHFGKELSFYPITEADIAAGYSMHPLYDTPAPSRDAAVPASGGVRKYVPHDTFERIVREAADEIAGGHSVKDVLRGAITLALSSAPATPSPAEEVRS